MYLASELAHEVESGLVDLELSRSMPRHRLVTRSLLLAMSIMLAAAVLMFAGTYAGERLFATDLDLPSAEVRLRLLAHLLGIGLCFSAFALWLGTASRRWMTAFTTALLTAIVLYLVDFLAIGWRPMQNLAWFSPFHYYPALSIIAGDAPAWRNLLILLSVAALFTGAAYRQFQRRDL
jgi:ABC-type transport system involved in multi-copper enzyme maturation permease subunit